MSEESRNIKRQNMGTQGRRSFLKFFLGLFGSTGLLGAIPIVRMLSTTKDVEAQKTSKVDISTISEGTLYRGEYQGKPLFVLHRTKEMIEEMQKTSGGKDLQPDKDRVKKPEWLVVIGVCTHLGCTPLWKPEEAKGWHCPCHGSYYDFSARIIKGPAPKNLEVPPYTFKDDKTIIVGLDDKKGA